MGSDQHFCLRWNNFHSNIATSFEHLRDHEEFVDVTLACEGRSLKAHKVVLSACSPYFKDLLKDNPCQHPIIILRDVAFADVSALLNFVYQGEVYVAQDRLQAFLHTAEMLHIKGLTDENTNPQNSVCNVGVTKSCIIDGSHGSLIINSMMRTPSPPPQSPLIHTPVHISPPPKKRRLVSSPTQVTPTASSPATPSSPHLDSVTPKVESLSPRIESSTLAAALTKPLSSSSSRHESRSSQLSNQQASILPVPPLLPASHVNTDVPKVKQEVDCDSVKDDDDDSPSLSSSQVPPEHAVNFVTEGSILRQRIQGFQGTPDAPMSIIIGGGGGGGGGTVGTGSVSRQSSLLSSSCQDESSVDDQSGADSYPGSESVGGDYGGDSFTEPCEKEVLSGSPMVIRSSLIGLLPREAAGLFPGPGTSGSLSHDSSQDAPARQRWRCMQPRLCPFCWKTFSNSFNLKQHIVNVHTMGEGIECDLCHKVVKNKWYLRKHHVTAHGAPLRRSKNTLDSKSSSCHQVKRDTAQLFSQNSSQPRERRTRKKRLKLDETVAIVSNDAADQ